MTQQTFTQGHALIAGIGDDPKLKCTINDAKGLAAILKDEGRCAYPAGQVHLLTEGQATRAGILDALDELAKNAGQDATVMIYFSGHGYVQNGAYYLIPHGCTQQTFPATAITGAEFATKIAAIPATRKVILLDCCHAGGAGDVKGPGLSKSPLPQEALDLFQQGSGYVVIASSTEKEYSLTGNPYSVFTGVMIEALCGQGVAKNDGCVRVADLAGHTRERVPLLTNNKQHPVLHFIQADNFVIAYYAGGEGEPKALPFDLKAEDDHGDALDDPFR
ncbi:MAG: caspase family protein [Gammaproteobacteria bacterium]|nr:caspase family protein [Gammaproteobacteria bacterium]